MTDPADACRQTLRPLMPVASQYAYFDHAAVAPLPKPTAEALVSYALEASQQGDVPWLNWAGLVSRLREYAAQLIGASTDEIALVPNTTHGIGLVAEGFPWREGDNVVFPANEFPSNALPWQALQRRGVEVRRVAVPASGEVDWSVLEQAIDDRTRILSLSWVGFASGYRVDVARAVELAHRRGALLMLDAIQGVGAFPIDVHEAEVDFLCADGHKWMLGPEGAGMLYVRQEHLPLLTPLGLGWNSLASGAFDPAAPVRIKLTAARYEGGTINMPGMHGFGQSLKLLCELGAAEATSPVAAAILQNVERLDEALSRVGFEVHLPAVRTCRSGIIGVSWDCGTSDSDAVYNAARKFCLQRQVVLSVRGGRLRVSTHAYNNEADIERLVSTLHAFRTR